jgi:hypothetical protein
MVSGVVYRLLGLVELSTERMDGGDEILAQATGNSVSLLAYDVLTLESTGRGSTG